MIDVETPPTIRVRRFAAWAGQAAADAGVGRTSVRLLVVLSVAYVACTWTLAHRKLMWNDELYTYYIASLPSMHDVIGALTAGGEQTPPLFYLVTRLALKAFGVNNIAIRVPEMIAFWLTVVCLYRIVARRMSGVSAVCAAAFPLVTSAFMYAYEARPYALVLGFTALSFHLWQIAANSSTPRVRAVALVGLALSLAAAVCSHYYGVFVLLPFGLGETVRAVRSRRIDVPMWCALAASVVALAWHVPLIKAAMAYSGAFWSPPRWVNAPDFYQNLLWPALMPMSGIAILAALQAQLAQSPRESARGDQQTMPVHELAAAGGFALLPVVCVIIAKLVTGAFVDRYALPAVIGFGVLAGVCTEVAFARRPVLRVAAAAGLCGWFVLAQAREWVEPTGVSQPFPPALVSRPAEWVGAIGERDLPIAIADAHTFTMLSHYGAPTIQPRIVYLADPDRALARLGHNSVERGMLDLLKPWFRMNVVPFEPFVARHPRFLVYGDFVRLAFLNWLEPELRARGMQLELLNRAGDNMLLLASRDPR